MLRVAGFEDSDAWVSILSEGPVWEGDTTNSVR